MNSNKRPPKYFYFVMVLMPVLFLVLLEAGLRTFNYGKDLSLWIKINDSKYGVNPDMAFRYFYNTEGVPNSIQDVFNIHKTDNTYRIFVLGGSSAAGFPYMPLGSFSRYIQRRLELFYPQKNIEVVNLSLTAVNSYTIRDLIPEVLEQEPDLILIYAGHNEYYGALGVGSLESLGSSRWVVNTILYLNKFKTVQLIRDLSKSLMSLVKSSGEHTSGTLMSRMAAEQSIEYDSDLYFAGIDQFQENINDVISSVTSHNIPIVLSTVASNLKDQKPFISSDGTPSANNFYLIADSLYKAGQISASELNYRKAKDYDMLRFRAPEVINRVIKDYSGLDGVFVVDSDSMLNKISKSGIAGNDYFIDHLHPNLRGYQRLGKFFVDQIINDKLLPSPDTNADFHQQDSITIDNFYFSKLDSVISKYRIIMLRNDWPFVMKGAKVNPAVLIKPENFIDSLAYNVVTNRLPWALSQKKAAEYYIRIKDYKSFATQMDILINQYPFADNYYEFAYMELMKANRYNEALKFLLGKYKIRPDEFTSKWIGIIKLKRNKLNEAVKYLEESLTFKPNDPQLLYNLAGAYAKLNQYNKAYATIVSCLNLKPDYTEALKFKNSLESFIDK